MKILLVGASGTIGKAVKTALSKDNNIITANYSGGDVQVDLGSPESIRAMFTNVGAVDAIISTAGVANFGAFEELTEADYELALQNKLMGQINLIRFGLASVNTGGSITLTSGILSRQPLPGSSVISMANGALESYVKAAVLELRSARLNVVAPAFVKETMVMMGMDTDGGLSAADTAKAYVSAVTGNMTGQTLDAPDFV
ncbi:short chain dehydrogenase [Amphritea japonica]|uniref:Short chain dehydrogenase n=1 Tax=Amphritea japonica ATCC BAA-1530 TaxID=1278309 RepID=A0A7R6P463_9GAMM|nr:short chain dehydrogenase [Amphritea japonica]BBB25614.1 short chain dehydrogenase [Amphritea japonica ATCC BAA-1530]